MSASQPRHRQAPRKPRAPQQPPQTRVTVTAVLPPDSRTVRPPVDRARHARSVRIAYLVILALVVLLALALVGNL